MTPVDLDSAPDNKIRRIAVISIHGVGDHLPNDMAKAVARMLLSRDHDRYSAFTETTMCAKVQPVRLKRMPTPLPAGVTAWGPMDAHRLANGPLDEAIATKMNSIDHVFMEGQLRGYQPSGAEDSWEFLRLDGELAAEGGKPKKQVHIYDMYWSDLSGVGNSAFSIFIGLYQLLFHLGSVGFNNVMAAASSPTIRADKKAAAKWDLFAKYQKATAAMLALPIGLLNLILFTLACVLFLVSALAKHSEPVIGCATAILLALAFYLCLLLVRSYDKWRPGALITFKWLWPPLLLLSAISVYFAPPFAGRFPAMALLLRTGEVGSWLLTFAWSLFWITTIASCFAGRQAVKAVESSKIKGVSAETERVRSTNWTARLTIGLTATLFLLVTFFGWAAFLLAGSKMLPANPALDKNTNASVIKTFCPYDTLCYKPIPFAAIGKSGETELASKWIDEALWDAGVRFIPILLMISLLALGIAIFAVGPSVKDEVFPPSGSDPKQADSLGNWLENGFRRMRLAGRLLYGGVFLFPPFIVSCIVLLGMLEGKKGLLEWLSYYDTHVANLVPYLAGLIASTAVGALAFSGRLSKMAPGLRTAVRVGLDVDDWLREHPEGTNPTAKICARYSSLLRQISRWRNESGEGYDSLVIFAHSQGTVITADLFRFLNVEAAEAGGFENYDNSLLGVFKMPKYLFTVGCPLMQLYRLRFPYFYGYAAKAGPDPAKLGLAKWVNAYRTGDYVGRNLIDRKDKYDPTKRPVIVSFEEFAIGPGAHTHYWDKTADAIACELDAIIQQA